MRRICFFLAMLLTLGLLCIPAAAASAVTEAESTTIVSPDGSAKVTIRFTLNLEDPAQDLAFPIPKDAQQVQLNAADAKTHKENGCLQVALPGPGTYTVSYTLPRVVTSQKTSFLVEVPLLSGFSYALEALEFTVTLPDGIEHEPVFTSGYHQEDIDASLDIRRDGNTVFGTVTQRLKDHETLTIKLKADPAMFPALQLEEPILTGWEGAVLIFGALGILYYCICLLPVAPRRIRSYNAPEGISAGEVGTCLTGCGADLTFMVLTWAQLGYLQIELGNNRRVSLHKRMEMGNERSEFECRVFRDLFRNRTVVTGTSYHYARMCKKVAGKSPLLRQLFKPSSGNPMIFRGLCLICGVFAGVVMAVSASEVLVWQVLLGIVFAALGGVFSYFIQAGGKCLPLRDKFPLVMALGAMGLWLLLGLMTGSFPWVLGVSLFQFVSGVAAAYGGRRSERGKRCLAQIRSLRHFMVSAPGGELQRMIQLNPSYFYELVPYALVLGVEKKFARHLGKMPLPEQNFLMLPQQKEMTAMELVKLLGTAVDSLNGLQKRLPYQQMQKRGRA